MTIKSYDYNRLSFSLCQCKRINTFSQSPLIRSHKGQSKAEVKKTQIMHRKLRGIYLSIYIKKHVSHQLLRLVIFIMCVKEEFFFCLVLIDFFYCF